MRLALFHLSLRAISGLKQAVRPSRSDSEMRKVLYIMGQLSDSDVEWLGVVGARVKVHKGEVLIRVNDRIDTIYIVLDGTMAIISTQQIEVGHSGCGEILGEMSFVDSSPASATVTAKEDSIVLAIKKSVLQQKLNEDTAFAARFYRAIAIFLADRMRKLIGAASNGIMNEDELDENVLDNVYLAGARFDRILKKLMG